MQIKVQKWGNSLAVRIPKAIAAEVSVTENSIVEISVDKNVVVLKRVKGKRLRLRELVKGITKENMHSEFEWGAPVGKEIW